MIVAKFGGGLLNGVEGLLRVRDEIAALPRPLVVVASAFARMTNRLEEIASTAVTSEHAATRLLEDLAEEHRAMARELFDDDHYARWSAAVEPYFARLQEVVAGLGIVHELSPRTMDLCVSFGELLSSATLLCVLQSSGIDARSVPAADLIITDNRHRFARPNIELTSDRVGERLVPLLAGDSVVITEGYIARSASGEITTMGRESSNYSATLLAKLAGATEVRVYTAVEGVMTADPSLIVGARAMPHLSYGAAQTMAELGAKILHPRTVTPVEDANIPLIIRAIGSEGTRIDRAEDPDGYSVVLLSDATLLSIHVAAVSTPEDEFVRALSAMVPLVWRTRFRRRLQIVTASRVDEGALPLRHLDGSAHVESIDGAVVSLVRQHGIDAEDAAAFFTTLGDRIPHAILGGIDEHAVSVFLSSEVDAATLVRALHDRFVLEGDMSNAHA